MCSLSFALNSLTKMEHLLYISYTHIFRRRGRRWMRDIHVYLFSVLIKCALTRAARNLFTLTIGHRGRNLRETVLCSRTIRAASAVTAVCRHFTHSSVDTTVAINRRWSFISRHRGLARVLYSHITAVYGVQYTSAIRYPLCGDESVPFCSPTWEVSIAPTSFSLH